MYTHVYICMYIYNIYIYIYICTHGGPGAHAALAAGRRQLRGAVAAPGFFYIMCLLVVMICCINIMSIISCCFGLTKPTTNTTYYKTQHIHITLKTGLRRRRSRRGSTSGCTRTRARRPRPQERAADNAQSSYLTKILPAKIR